MERCDVVGQAGIVDAAAGRYSFSVRLPPSEWTNLLLIEEPELLP
jgi:hypothetical protein